MKKGTIIFISLIITLAVWALFSWPLPKHFSVGIPASAENIEKDGIRQMIPGDHLQLLYHFWLAGDMLKGKTKFLYNPYEFNQGDDTDRFLPGSYYAPFSIVYAVTSFLSNRATGWNITGILSLWFTMFLTWRLTKRYTDSEFLACMSAVISIVLTYRWINLLGGSPAGFAIMWVPMLLLGLDLAIRTYSLKGGFLAGIALLFACFTDSHVFIFSVLITPLWCLLALIRNQYFELCNIKKYGMTALALLPTTAMGIIALVYRTVRSGRLESTVMKSGRTWQEVALHSPSWHGLFSYDNLGHTNHIFIGYTIAIIVIIGVFVFARKLKNNPITVFPQENYDWRQFIIFFALCSMVIGIIVLALGTRGPLGGKPLHACRKLIPKYNMIRQPAKIYCLIAPFLALCLVMIFTAIKSTVRPQNRWFVTFIAILCAVCITAESKAHIKATVSLLATEQAAYATIANDAATLEIEPHALAIPLWPGDSAWSSLYEHYASLYRIRMLNGYSPIVTTKYKDNIFKKLGSANKGMLTDNQLDLLKKMNITYILFHEDAFPEKVSPLPALFTMKNLLNHPRLKLIKQAGPVLAFRILTEPAESTNILGNNNIFLPARQHEFERTSNKTLVKKVESGVSGSGFVTLTEEDQTVTTKGTHMCPALDLKWLIRVRGSGTLAVRNLTNKQTVHEDFLTIKNNAWQWKTVPVEKLTEYAKIGLELGLTKGTVDLDCAILYAGSWNMPEPGQSLSLPAAAFFHAGASDLKNLSVKFRKNIDHAAEILIDENSVKKLKGDQGSVLYGPRLPLHAGKYRVDLTFESNAESGTKLGSFHVRQGKNILCFEYVRAGSSAWSEIQLNHNLPITLDFLYSGEADISIKRIVFAREQ
ncbi:MAG: hypothetical protein KAH23_04725 [Kiritimatiellae bacterium]|nr:hypothetical protein [Kiritimatiellia bacterium]